MKPFLIALLALTLAPMASLGASLEDGYIAARDGYIKKFAKADSTKQEQAALRQLEKQLRRVLGPSLLKGVTGPGKINVESLSSGDVGFGALDGLAYASKDDKTRIVVTTETLFTRWLRAHKNWWNNDNNVPQDIAGALASEAFYTQAISSDAAVFKYAELPIAKPLEAKAAFAMLVARGQDIGPQTPAEILVSVVQGGRLFVISAPAAAKVAGIPACDEIWQKSVKDAEAILETYRETGANDEALFNRYTKTQDDGDAGFRRCFGERVKSAGNFTDLTRQAQTLADQLPVK